MVAETRWGLSHLCTNSLTRVSFAAMKEETYFLLLFRVSHETKGLLSIHLRLEICGV